MTETDTHPDSKPNNANAMVHHDHAPDSINPDPDPPSTSPERALPLELPPFVSSSFSTDETVSRLEKERSNWLACHVLHLKFPHADEIRQIAAHLDLTYEQVDRW